MTKEQLAVKEFMQKAEQEYYSRPTYSRFLSSLRQLRVNLIAEECDELDQASSIEEIADALGDLLYVIYGAAVAHGIDLEPIFEEIHRSNMTKFIDGHRREDGKWVKGPSYSPANLKPIIESQMK